MFRNVSLILLVVKGSLTSHSQFGQYIFGQIFKINGDSDVKKYILHKKRNCILKLYL